MKRHRRYRPQPLVVAAPTLAGGAHDLAHLALIWQEFTAWQEYEATLPDCLVE
jgi:hypothetical protein